MSSETKSEQELKDQPSPDSIKQSSKKRKPSAGGAHRRTKTGCLTCRQRRVKCDEMKPTCRNCEKSRRQCAGYQPSTLRAQIPMNPSMQTPPHYMPHAGIPQSSIDYFHPFRESGSASRSPFSPDVPQAHFGTNFMPNDSRFGYEWPVADGSFVIEQPHVLTGHDWMHNPVSGPQTYAYGMQHARFADVRPATYSVYPGRQSPQPSSLDTPCLQDQFISQSASTVSLQWQSSATHADLQKSSFRREKSDLTSATSSQPSLTNAPDSFYPQATRPHRSASSRSQYNPMNDYEDPEDPWDVDTDDEFCQQEAVVNFTTPRSLILDERKAYMLKHFVTFLRPCISIHERPLAFDGSSTFAEVLPTLALSCRGLLHGIMAISALHLAILHRTSEVIPLKHFVIASKKLARLISFPSTRHKLDTLALCLGLAFYEVLLGDHARWVLHLRGAAALLLEHNYASFVRSSRKMRARAKENLAQPWIKHEEISWQDYVRIAGIPAALLPDDEWEIDEELIRKLTGLDVDYANQIQASAKSTALGDNLSQDEIQEWRTKMDLLFWYLKMDIFQSILSGDPLLLPYKNWKFFPPRGRLGVPGNAHVTMDYLWLIMGRLAEFGSKDRARKLKRLSSTGGVWKPEPGFLAPPGGTKKPQEGGQKQASPDSNQRFANAPNANEGRTRIPKQAGGSSTSKKGPPLFWGMMPPPKIPASMLSSFHITDTSLCGDTGNEKPVPTGPASADVVSATKEAIVEHQAISEALNIWRQSLDKEFEPLPSPPSTPGAPFTPSLRYRDPMIACIWSLFHLAKILLRRYHPHSPPAMMQSAVVNLHITAEDANAIGRINAGLLEGQAELARAGSINPTLVAALQELTFPLMFAGVQYQDPAERAGTINNLLELSNGSGWRTAFAVASALEASWAGQGGYSRTLAQRTPNEASKYNREVSSDTVSMSSQDEHESRFVNHDRRLIDKFSDIRAFWAMGLLSSTEDLSKVLGEMSLDGK